MEIRLREILFETLVILFLILLNGFFAMFEISLISSRKSRLQDAVKKGNRRAKTALELAESPNTFLSTVQIGITLIGIFAGAYGGASIADNLSVFLNRYEYIAPYSDSISLGIIVVIITYLSLILGELAPKRVALNNPEKIAAMFAGPMKALSAVASPLVKFLGFSTDVILRVLNIKPTKEPPVTEDEIRALIEQGAQAGVFEEYEQDMVERIFKLGDKRVNVLMERRRELEFIDINDTPEQIMKQAAETRFSRLPVCDGNIDHLLGIVAIKDLLLKGFKDGAPDLKPILKKPLYVHENMKAYKALELFKKNRTRFALVINEYGSIEGLITITDILESIVGDIEPDPEDEAPAILKRDDGSYLIDGLMLIDELKDELEMNDFPKDEDREYDTLAGFILMQMDKIPTEGDKFAWRGYSFEVIDMDGNRIDKVLVKKTGNNLD
jgi:putative hemolysin